MIIESMGFDGQPDQLAKFLEYSAELSRSLERLEQVIGLVFVGSASDVRRVDEWSDHDFFVVTKSGFAQGLRENISWLPRHERISIAPRETEHGLKVIYDDGQVLEFAVFNDPELELASVNSYFVAFDRTNIAHRMATIASRPKEGSLNIAIEFELFLSQILIGVGRARRGELLSARQFINSFAMSHVLGLIRAWLTPVTGTENDEDDLNRFRRFEFQYPDVGKALAVIQQLEIEPSAREMLGVIRTLGQDQITKAQQKQIEVVERRLGWKS